MNNYEPPLLDILPSNQLVNSDNEDCEDEYDNDCRHNCTTIKIPEFISICFADNMKPETAILISLAYLLVTTTIICYSSIWIYENVFALLFHKRETAYFLLINFFMLPCSAVFLLAPYATCHAYDTCRRLIDSNPMSKQNILDYSSDRHLPIF